MLLSWKRTWPEFLIALAATFFFLRELGSFPEAWQDDSLFMIVARNLAEGRGYVLPVLDHLWWGSYFLAVGPTVITPSALSIKLFGFSIAAARLPMVGYLAAQTVATYVLASRIGSRWNARAATILLVSFSAFVNTGKPVLGEIPGVLCIVAALLVWPRERSIRQALLCGTLLGLAFVTKTTMGIVYPALGCAWIVAVLRRDPAWKDLLVVGIVSLLVIIPFMPILGMTDRGWLQEIVQYGAADGGSGMLRVLREQPWLLLRFQYVYALGVILPLGILGIYTSRKSLGATRAVFLGTVIALFVLYFLNERGYFRHLLPAHLLLIPFVALGLRTLVHARIATVILTVFVLAQGLWQLDHRGSRRLNEAQGVAEILERDFRETRMVIEPPELFVRLSFNEHWLFLSEEFASRRFDRFPDLPMTQQEHCLPLLKKMGTSEQKNFSSQRIHKIADRYVILTPEANCTRPYETAQ